MNTLVAPFDLENFQGAPFDDTLIDATVAAIRAEAGWHIAPVVSETLTVDSYGGTLLVLPTRRVVTVTEIRFVSTLTGIPEVLTGWTRMRAGIYRNRGFCGWPVGEIEVDLSHGYDEAPVELLQVIADRIRNGTSSRDPSVVSRTVGQISETYRAFTAGSTAGTLDPVIARYAVPAGVA